MTNYIIEKANIKNNKAKRIFETSTNNGLFNDNQVVLHAYETRAKFTVYVHENVKEIVSNDSRFSINPHYTERLNGNEKYKNEKFSHLYNLFVDVSKCANEEERATKRNDALSALIDSLNATCEELKEAREEAKREEEARKEEEAKKREEEAKRNEEAKREEAKKREATKKRAKK